MSEIVTPQMTNAWIEFPFMYIGARVLVDFETRLHGESLSEEERSRHIYEHYLSATKDMRLQSQRHLPHTMAP